MKIGSHVGNAGTDMLKGSVLEAVSYDANCFMVYLGAPQNTYRKPLSQLKIPEMRDLLDKYNININDVVVHAPYIVNLAQGDLEKRNFAIDFITKEVKYCYEAGFKTIVLHPGAHVGQGIDTGITNIVSGLIEILERTSHTDVNIAIETMAGKGSEVGSNFSELQEIIKTVNSPRIKVCFDTCHTFDSGYDLVNNYDGVFQEFDKIIGFERLAVIHVNDSKNVLGSKKDRHANIGFGNIGFETLHRVITDKRFVHIPKILETPYVLNPHTNESLPPYKYEIAMIKSGQFNPNLIEDIINHK